MIIAFFIYFGSGYEYRLLLRHHNATGQNRKRSATEQGLSVGPAPYEIEEHQRSSDGRLRILIEIKSTARILAKEFVRRQKV